jgi:predicted ATPase
MNNLSHIKIEGFKSIKKLDLEMKPINVLIGANGSGKSNFISVFNLLKYTFQNRLQTYITQSGGANNFLHFGSKHTKNIRLELTFNQKKINNIFFINNEDNFSQPIVEYMTDFNDLQEDKTYSEYIKFLSNFAIYHFHDTSSTAKFKSYQDINANQFLASFAENLAPFLYRLKNEFPKDYQNIVNAVQTVAPYFQDFDFNINGENILLRWQHKNDLSNLGFSAQTLSDGTARFICMATLFLQPKDLRPATIVLDELEIGLHPDAITVLSEIIKAVANGGTQVIISTQSVTLANCFEPDDFIIVDYENGESKFKRFEQDKQEELKEWLDNYQMGETWENGLIGALPK